MSAYRCQSCGALTTASETHRLDFLPPIGDERRGPSVYVTHLVCDDCGDAIDESDCVSMCQVCGEREATCDDDCPWCCAALYIDGTEDWLADRNDRCWTQPGFRDARAIIEAAFATRAKYSIIDDVRDAAVALARAVC